MQDHHVQCCHILTDESFLFMRSILYFLRVRFLNIFVLALQIQNLYLISDTRREFSFIILYTLIFLYTPFIKMT